MESDGRCTEGEVKTVGSDQPRRDGNYHKPRAGVHWQGRCSGQALPGRTQHSPAFIDGDSWKEHEEQSTKITFHLSCLSDFERGLIILPNKAEN